MDKARLEQSAAKVRKWVEDRDYKGYDPGDGLTSFLRPLTFRNIFAERVLQQAIWKAPINVRVHGVGLPARICAHAADDRPRAGSFLPPLAGYGARSRASGPLLGKSFRFHNAQRAYGSAYTDHRLVRVDRPGISRSL